LVVLHSSRERPGDIKKRRDRLEHRFAGQEPDSAIAAGNEIGPENPLKVEARVRTPLGLQAKAQVRRLFAFERRVSRDVRPAFVPRTTSTRHGSTGSPGSRDWWRTHTNPAGRRTGPTSRPRRSGCRETGRTSPISSEDLVVQTVERPVSQTRDPWQMQLVEIQVGRHRCLPPTTYAGLHDPINGT
jgi:hypothetical protein